MPETETILEPKTSLVVQPAGVTEPVQIKEMPESWKALNLVIDDCNPSRMAGYKQFEIAYMMADGVDRLRKLMVDEVMKPIMSLMNTEIGFLTDRGPHISVRDDKDNWKMTPYCEAVVRDVMVTALLHGVWPVGNQFNIIAGKFYITQGGYLYKMKHVPGLTDLQVDLQPPMQAGNGLAKIAALCTWKLYGTPSECSQTFAMKAGSYDTADSLRGKSYRKILKAAHQQITGGSLLGISSDRDDFNQITPPENCAAPSGITSNKSSAMDELSGATSSRTVAMDELIDAYSETWNIDQIASIAALRAYVKKVFNFDSMGPCQITDFEELLRRVQLGPFHKDRIPCPDEISKQQLEPTP